MGQTAPNAPGTVWIMPERQTSPLPTIRQYPVPVPVVSERDALRDYLIRYAVVESVDNQGDACPHCQELASYVTCNIYATTWTGEDATAQSCNRCALAVVDEHLDVDPSFVVTIERAQPARVSA